MTQLELENANELAELIKKFEQAKQTNLKITVRDAWIEDADLRPDTQAKIKQILIDELDYLKSKFLEM